MLPPLVDPQANPLEEIQQQDTRATPEEPDCGQRRDELASGDRSLVEAGQVLGAEDRPDEIGGERRPGLHCQPGGVLVDPGRELPLRATWTPRTVVGTLGLTALGALALHLMGRRLWCASGSLSPWSWDIWSLHNSQHLLDPYTFTHLLHGALYYALLWLVFRSRWPSARAFLAAMADIAAFTLGYIAAMRLPAWASAVGFLAVEAALLLTIRDSLLLNVLMLLHPVATIKTWQMGG